MLRTGWVVVRRMTRVPPWRNSMARVVSDPDFYQASAADPRTGSTGHLLDNLAVEHVALDGGALRELAGVGA